jgi:hypothetical protein
MATVKMIAHNFKNCMLLDTIFIALLSYSSFHVVTVHFAEEKEKKKNFNITVSQPADTNPLLHSYPHYSRKLFLLVFF